MKLKIKAINNDEPRPILVQFENGVPSKKCKKIKTHIYKDRSKLNEDCNVVVAATDTYIYDGVIGEDLQSALYNTFVGVRKKDSKKIKLYAVDTVMLTPYKKQKMTDEEVTTDKSKRMTQINELNKKFGSKKIARMVEARERININVESIKERLDNTLQETHVTEVDAAPKKQEDLSTVMSYLPPINRDAKSVEEVYLLHDLISLAELEIIKSKAETILETKFEELKCCPYVSEEIAKLQSSSCTLSEELKLEKCSVWLYIDSLISFLKEAAKNLQKRTYMCCDFSTEINKKILDAFTVAGQNSRLRPQTMRDKCLCYVLVLAILVSNKNVIDIESFSVSVKTPISKLKQLCLAVAAKPTGKGGTLYGISLPLPAIATTMRRKRK